ncbi:carbohydrate ABC transporter permease [Nocardia aurantia]|uniref:sn-glycerol-3-phosphate transport system permease protein UgpA n=1 Tax=Nocardia aurantia TaxID=2585199 RepID=A0A7K0DTC4_9NOCA|nr:sugar ABC transporter permease [Nocardia aurantia]MQY28084.1 sn-glycerol-3-phosphate transport system permease protein UgpA [Nocardia aurantia]
MLVAVRGADTPSAATTVPARPGRPWWRRIPLAPYLYVLPALAMLVVWVYTPLCETFQLSFYHWNLIPSQPKKPVGMANYTAVVQLPELHKALVNTGIYIGSLMVFSLVLPLLIAILSQRVSGRARTFYQALIFVPFLVTPVATSAVWRWMFAPDGGTITVLAKHAGLDLGNVFRSPAMAIWAVVAICGWQMLGFGVLVVSAGLAGIDPDYGAAAALDGASAATVFRRITLPLLSPTLVFLGLMTILLGAQWTYPVIDILTQGGPSDSTTNIYYLLYEFGFRNFDAGSAAAAGMLFFLGFGVIALIFVELSERLSFYDN